jgi:hypothetical protein
VIYLARIGPCAEFMLSNSPMDKYETHWSWAVHA